MNRQEQYNEYKEILEADGMEPMTFERWLEATEKDEANSEAARKFYTQSYS